MHRRRFISGSLAAAAAALDGCSSEHPAYRSSPDKSDDVEQTFGGAAALGLLHKFERADAFRIEDSEFHEKIDAYKTVTGPIRIDPVKAKELAVLLMDAKSYLWDILKSCGEPIYGVRIRFTGESGVLDVLFCFQCDVLTAYWNGAAARSAYFDPIQPKLVFLMKSLFPADAAIQQVKPRQLRSAF